MIYNKKDIKRAVGIWNISYDDDFTIIVKDVKNYDYADNGFYYKSTSSPYLKRVNNPIVKRSFISVNGDIVTDPLTDYKLIKTIDSLDTDYGYGHDIVKILTGKKGKCLID